jgi:ABC-type multidrug transport system ATPase subunit
MVLKEPVTIADPTAPVPVGRLRGDLAFELVSFAYGDNPALTEAVARIPAGTVCALVGPSGAGKTTFANLVPRFYETATGRVTIDGTDVRAMRLADLRRNIALVSQEPVLFNDTIYQNLLLGRPDATRDEVMAAAIDAHADDFIRTFPQGYDTIVGERGALLSGGQKQRVALARAFLRNAPVLILDEATSALDSDSEAAVQDALRKLVVGKTVLIIAHRFSTIRDASMILVFDKGRITASGTHAELYTANPLYRSLYDRQHGGSAVLHPILFGLPHVVTPGFRTGGDFDPRPHPAPRTSSSSAAVTSVTSSSSAVFCATCTCTGPGHSITLLAEPGYAAIAALNPDVATILTFPRRLAEWPRLLATLRRARFTHVLDFDNTDKTAWLTRWTGAAVRVTYDRETNPFRHRWVYTHCAPVTNAFYDLAAHHLDLPRPPAAIGVPRVPRGPPRAPPADVLPSPKNSPAVRGGRTAITKKKDPAPSRQPQPLPALARRPFRRRLRPAAG